jgi:hypothetical protein
MDFFEFVEAAPTTRSAPRSAPAPRPTPRPAPSTPPRTTSSTTGSAARRPAPTTTGTGTAAGARRPSPTPAPTRPAPSPTPARRPPAPDARPSDGSRGLNLDRLLGYVPQAFDAARQVTQFAQQIGVSPRPSGTTPAAAPPPDGADAPAAGVAPSGPVDTPSPSPEPAAAGTMPATTDPMAPLLQALQQRQIPPLPGPTAPPSPYVSPLAPGAPRADGTALLGLILGNPQFQQALQWAAALGPGAARTVQLPVPATAAARRMRSVAIPLGAVMNAISALASRSMVELNATTAEDEPEVPAYLVDEEGEFIVDPASPEERAALVAHLFRVSGEPPGSASDPQAEPGLGESDGELDESEEWALEAGFTG